MDSKYSPSMHFRLQRLALLPTANSLQGSDISSCVDRLSDDEQQKLLEIIIRQGLQFFWMEILRFLPDHPFTETSRDALKDSCFRCAIEYLAQKKTLLEVDRLFEDDQIPYVVFKGAHVREVVFENPVFRPSVDIDILVSPTEKLRAIRSLCTNGYTLQPNWANLSHEVTLVKKNVHLDLHWHVMRPGRTRVDLTERFLRSRKRQDFFWALDNEMTLLVMLSHPVFTEYSTGPQSSMVKLVDLQRWISEKEIDWQRLLHLLQDAGLKTAAWITATVLNDLTECCLPGFVGEAIRPANPKRSLLGYWLNMNLSTKLSDYPVFPKYIFTLMAHDNVRDIVTFIQRFREERRKDTEVLAELLDATR